MENIENITNNIKAVDTDLEALRQQFPQCFDKDGKFNVEKFKLHLKDKEVDFSTESYCLNWLGKSYARLIATDSATTLLKENVEHNFLPENRNSQNVLIKGDNLEVLKHLVGAYREKVKMIYIDPPYNTGSDGFVYQDDRKFTVKELRELADISEEQAKRILNFTQSKSNSHSAWLTFMYPRLYIAKQLLKDDGVIFISIDDNEVAQLRLLMDEIFGEENFVATIVRQEKAGSGHDSKGLAIEFDYVHCYSKNSSSFSANQVQINTENDKKYKLEDEYLETRGKYYLRDLDYKGSYSESMDYPIILPNNLEIWPGGKFGQPNTWRWSKKKFEWGLENGFIVFKEDKVYIKQYQLVDNDGNETDRYLPYRALTRFLNSEGAKDLAKLNLKDFFKFPKPVDLLKYLIRIAVKENCFILDFFAGSGTTGDAVMQLNTEDGGNRKYILVQIPEPIDPKKDKLAYDFVVNELNAEPTIFEITKERLIRAAKKIQKELTEKADMFENEQPLDLGFKVFETSPIWDNYDFDAYQFEETLQLFDYSQLTADDIQMLLTTWKTYDGIPLTEALQQIAFDDYTSYYVNGKLYLMHKGFSTDHLKILLEKIDNDSHFEVKTISAFGFHFESKSLRELAENVKSYNNKKNTDIDFIIRY